MKALLATALLVQVVTPDAGDPGAAADRLLQRHVKVSQPGVELVRDRTIRDGEEHTVVRYVLQVDGVPVLGRGAAVRVGGWVGAPGLVHADVRLGGDSEVRVPGSWRLTAHDAVAVALGALSDPRVRGGADALRASRAILPGEPPRRVWVVDVPLVASGPLTLRLLVAGDKPRVVDWARIDLGAGRANVFPTNPAKSELGEQELTWLDDDTDVLEGRFARVYRCRLRDGECEERNAAVADPDGDYLYEPDDDAGNERDPFAEVSAYWHISRMRELMGDLGLESSELRRMRVWVNWPNLNNAAFVQGGPGGPAMIFGQGRRDFAYDGDVVYHEYGHAVVSVTAALSPVFGLGGASLDYRPGALNEGIADQLSTALSDDAQLGEYAGGYRYGSEIRDMEGDATCPEGQIGEEHHDAQPWGQAMWEVRDGLGDDDYLPLAWSTLTMLLPSSGTSEAAAAMEELAQQRFLGEDHKLQAVTGPISRHRLHECERYIPIDEGPGHSAVSMSSSELTQGQLLFDMPAHLHHTIEVPEGTAELRIIKRMIGCVLGCKQKIFLRHAEPVTFSLLFDGALNYDADHVFEEQTEVVLADPAPGTWYIGNSNGTTSTFIYSVTGDLVPHPEPDVAGEGEGEPDLGDDVQDDEGGGEGETVVAGGGGDLRDDTPKVRAEDCECGQASWPALTRAMLRR